MNMKSAKRERKRSKRFTDSVNSPQKGHQYGDDESSDSNSSSGISLPSPLLKKLGIGFLAIAIAASVFFGFPGFGGDYLSSQETQSRLTEYQSMLSSGGMSLAMVEFHDLDRALDAVPLRDEAQKRQLEQQVRNGEVQLAWLTLWDTHAEDGDVLRFESDASYPVDVTAMHAKTTLAIPYPRSGVVKVTGIHDGGGGITIALESGAAHISWPTMQPGDTLNLPVIPGI